MEPKIASEAISTPPMPSKMAHEAIAEHLRSGGSTFDPRTGQNLAGSRHIAVGVAPEHSVVREKPPTAQDHDNFTLQHHEILSRHTNSAVGTYHDQESGLHHMEIVGLTPSKKAALEMAAHLGENHVHNLTNDEKTPSGSDGTRAPSHLTPDQRLEHLRKASPKRETYSGVHYSADSLDKIQGARRGEPGPKGTPPTSDANRVRLGSTTGFGPDAPAGFYSHQVGSVPGAQIAGKNKAYPVRGQFAFGSTDSPEFQGGYHAGVQQASAAGAPPDVAHKLGLNSAEHALQDAGYDGYHSPKHPNVKFHFGDHEIQKPEVRR